MSKVSITRSKLDNLATSISTKSGATLPLTLDQMKTAVDNMSGGGSTLTTKNITANGTYNATDDSADGYSQVTVNVPSGSPTLQAKTYNVSGAGTSTVTADAGYDGLSSVAVSVPVGSFYTYAEEIGFFIENNVRKWGIRGTSELFPSEGDVEGWVGEGSYSGNVQKFNSVASTTITPTKSSQTIGGKKYMMEGAVTVNPIPSQYIIPTGNLAITQNGNGINVSDYATVSVNVSGGGGSSMNAQTAQSTTRATTSSYTKLISLTCSTTGTYDVYWSTFRSSTSGTWGSQLYINDTAYGSAQTGSWSNHIQNIHLTGVSITTGQTVSVGVRTRGSNYYGYVGTLTIEQTS